MNNGNGNLELILEIYGENYGNLQYKGISGLAHKIYHKKLEAGLNQKQKFRKVLEIGSGAGEHFKYVRHKYESYTMTEIDKKLIKQLNYKFKKNKKIKIEFADIENLPYKDGEFDRVVITCVLHHLRDIPRALKEIRRVVKCDGLISIYLPSDPGLFYRIVRRVAMLRKNTISLPSGEKVNRRILNAVEHTNHIQSIRDLIEFIFKEDTISKSIFPFKVNLWNINLFYVYQIKKNEG